ncbi:YciI family protein [Schaalia naturae]|uniref:YciI family protein n=1 Tax=Schaalia naturae TaxID=635203 RepID=A0ABW2SK39_9ACTO
MALYVIEYTYDPTLISLIRDHRPAHRTFLRGLHEQGILVASGFLRDDAMNEGALLVLRAPNARRALSLLDGDPFNQAGFIVERRVREWTPTIGEHADDFDTEFPIS